jgi:hypothetical protein
MASQSPIPVASIRFVKELYPRLKPIDEVIERYRASLDLLPPVTVARGGVLVDGYHRWQAHIREGAAEIAAEDLGDLTDAEIVRESIRRNASHGQQLSRADKQRLAGRLWTALAHLTAAERVKEITDLLSVSRDSTERWTKDARAAEQAERQARAWDLHLDCHSQRHIAEQMGVDQATIARWLDAFSASADFASPPGSRQHFDIWQFQNAGQDAGQQSYFGALPPQVVENLLWFWTEPGDIVVDPFAGSGTAVEVAKAMGRRVWASDRNGDRYAPYLPIHQHDMLVGWPGDAPAKAALVLLDPPYWQQAKGRYSDDLEDLANQPLDEFYANWASVAKATMEHTSRVAYIISPTQLDDGSVADHATEMLAPFLDEGWRVERRIIVPYQTQQATGQQVEWARENKRLLKLYRDLVVLAR